MRWRSVSVIVVPTVMPTAPTDDRLPQSWHAVGRFLPPRFDVASDGSAQLSCSQKTDRRIDAISYIFYESTQKTLAMRRTFHHRLMMLTAAVSAVIAAVSAHRDEIKEGGILSCHHLSSNEPLANYCPVVDIVVSVVAGV